MAALAKAMAYQPPPSSIQAAEGIMAKAKADEDRAYRVQRLREAEYNEAEIAKDIRRKQEALQVQDFLRVQKADKDFKEQIVKQEDAVAAEKDLIVMQDAIKMEQDMQEQRRVRARKLATEQRRQAKWKDEELNLKSGMSPRERAFNRDMFESLSGNPRSNTLSNTGRRLFG